MKRLITAAIILSVVCAAIAAWAANLLWYSLGNITGGIDAIAASCPKSPTSACAVGAIQFVAGVLGAAVGAYASYFGLWGNKRDIDGDLVYQIYEQPLWSPRGFKRGEDISSMLREHNASNPARIAFYHKDGSRTSGLYHFNSETKMHHIFGDMGLSSQLHKREVVGGNDGYAGAIHDDDTATYASVAHGKGDTNEWAQLAYNQMQPSNSDSVCMGMVDPDNNEKVAVVRLQPATNGDYQNLNTDACNGNGFCKRHPQSNSDVICQELCTIVDGPKEACLDAGGGCFIVDGGCNADLQQPLQACDGIVCEMRRRCD